MNDAANGTPRGIIAVIVNKFLTSHLSVILIMLAVCMGTAAVLVTPREEEPQIVVPLADMYVQFPGASAEEVEKLVATPLEKLLWQIDGVEYVYSMSRRDMAIMINGETYPVVTDVGIFEHNNINNANLLPGEYASSIYFVPLTVRENFPVTYMEFMDYKQSQPDINLLQNMPTFWYTDNGKFYWNYDGDKWCFILNLLTEQRIILRTPHLAGRIDYVKYEPLQHERDSDPSGAYHMDGGTSLRDLVDSPNAVWN